MPRARELAELATSYDSGGSLGFRNRIINGDCRIDQRNNGASGTAVAYTVDRWAYNATQATRGTWQQNAGSVTPPAGFTNYLGFTSSSAYSVLTGDTFYFSQLIEGLNVADLAWGTANAQTVTLSFWVRSSLTGTFGGAFANSASNRSYPFSYTVSSANTWEQKSITVPGDTTGTWLTTNGIGISLRLGLGSGATFSGTAGAWAAGNFVQPTGSVSVVGTNGATFYITGVQLEAGSVATPFERRDYGRELLMCQRYLPYLGGIASGNQSFGQCYSNSTTILRAAIKFPTQTRVPPTGLITSTASGFIGQMIGSSNLTASAISLTSINSLTDALIELTVSGATANQSGTLYNASSGFMYFTGCEL
jgi:hypothetical protein